MKNKNNIEKVTSDMEKDTYIQGSHFKTSHSKYL